MGRQSSYLLHSWLKHILKFQPLEDLYPFLSCVLHGHRHHFQMQDLSFSHYKHLEQLECWTFSGKHIYWMVVQKPSICLTCYFLHTRQPVPIKIKWSLAKYPTRGFSGPNSLAPHMVSSHSVYIEHNFDVLTEHSTVVFALTPKLKKKSYKRCSEFGGLHFYHSLHSNLCSVIK